MNIITIILTLSKREFDYETLAISDYIRDLSDQFIDRDIYFKLVICDENEPIDEKIAEIKNSHFFYILLGKDVSQENIERFNIAYNRFLEDSKTPKIYPYFKILPEGESTTDAIKGFVDRLRNDLGHYYSKFSYLDSVKLNMLLELTRAKEINATVKFEDGKATLDGREVLSLQNIPLYSKNESLQKLIKEREDLNIKFTQLLGKCSGNDIDPDLKNEISIVVARKLEIGDVIRQMEDDMLGLYSQISSRANSEEKMTWREIKAGELLDEGNYDGALAVLRDSEREKELEQAEKLAEGGISRIQKYLSEEYMRIKTLLTRGTTVENVSEITMCYEKTFALIKKYNLDIMPVYEYVFFSYNQRNFSKMQELAKYLYEHCETSGYADLMRANIYHACGLACFNNGDYDNAEKCWKKALETYENESEINTAIVMVQLSKLYVLKHLFEDAEKCAIRALEVYEKLANNNRDSYLKNLADGYDTLASFYNGIGKYDEAKIFYEKALEVEREYASKNQDSNDSRIAKGCNNLANVLLNYQMYDNAEALYKEALQIWNGLVVQNPSAYEPSIAVANRNLGNLFIEKNQFDEAEKRISISLGIVERLSKIHPDSYNRPLVSDYTNMAHLLYKMNRFDESEMFSRKAIDLAENLAEKEPDIYEPMVATAYSNLGLNYRQATLYKQAEKCFARALEFYRKLASVDNYKGALAACLLNAGELYKKIGKYPEALKAYSESLEIRKSQNMDQPGVYDSVIADIATSLANLYVDTKDYTSAEKNFMLSMDIRRRLEEKNPDTYRPLVAETCLNYFNLLKFQKKYDAAQKIIDEAIKIYEDLIVKHPNIYDLQLSMSYEKISELYRMKGGFEQAERFSRMSLDIRKRLENTNPKAYKEYAAGSYNNLGVLYFQMKKYEAALENFFEAHERYKELSLANPSAYKPLLADAYHNIAATLTTESRFEEAESFHLNAYEVRKELYSDNPEVYGDSFIICCHNLGDYYKKYNDLDKSRKYFDEQIMLIDKLAENNSAVYLPMKNEALNDLYLLAESYLTLGNKFAQSGETDSAKRNYNSAIEALNPLMTDSLDNSQVLKSSIMMRIGMLQYNEKLYDSAKQTLIQAENGLLTPEGNYSSLSKISKDRWLDDSQKIRSMIWNIYRISNSLDDALKYYDESVKKFIVRLDADSNTKDEIRAKYTMQLAILCMDSNLDAKAEELFVKAIESYNNIASVEDTYKMRMLALSYLDLGIVLMRLRKNDEVEDCLFESISLFSDLVDRGNQEFNFMLANAYYHLGYNLQLLKRNDEAIKRYNDALEIYKLLNENGKVDWSSRINSIESYIKMIQE